MLLWISRSPRSRVKVSQGYPEKSCLKKLKERKETKTLLF